MAGQFVRPFSFAQILKITIYDKFTNVMFRSVTPPNQQIVRKHSFSWNLSHHNEAFISLALIPFAA